MLNLSYSKCRKVLQNCNSQQGFIKLLSISNFEWCNQMRSISTTGLVYNLILVDIIQIMFPKQMRKNVSIILIIMCVNSVISEWRKNIGHMNQKNSKFWHYTEVFVNKQWWKINLAVQAAQTNCQMETCAFLLCHIYGFFVFNTNLTFLHKIDIEGFKSKKKLPPVGFELTTATIIGLEF